MHEKNAPAKSIRHLAIYVCYCGRMYTNKHIFAFNLSHKMCVNSDPMPHFVGSGAMLDIRQKPDWFYFEI